MRIYKEEYSYNSNYMISKVDNGLEESPLPILAFDVNPTIEEICDSVEFLIKSKWLGNNLFARKVTYYNRDKIDTGVLFSDQEETFARYEECGFYHQVEETPMVIGINHNRYKPTEYEKTFPNDLVLIKQDDGTILSRADYEEKQNQSIVAIKSKGAKKPIKS